MPADYIECDVLSDENRIKGIIISKILLATLSDKYRLTFGEWDDEFAFLDTSSDFPKLARWLDSLGYTVVDLNTSNLATEQTMTVEWGEDD